MQQAWDLQTNTRITSLCLTVNMNVLFAETCKTMASL
jgi:hypothetical protein